MISERQFLHDLSSVLGTASFLIDDVAGDVKQMSGVDPSVAERLDSIVVALERSTEMITKRRGELKSAGVPK